MNLATTSVDYGYKYIINHLSRKYYYMGSILKEDSDYNIIVGERSNGKTYSAKVFGVVRALHSQGALAIIRRYDLDFKNNCENMFTDIYNVIEDESSGKWNSVYYYGKKWYFCKVENGKRTETDIEPFAYAFSLTGEEHVKSVSYPTITTILFDEFITRNGYLDEELVKYTSIISTIVRKEDMRFGVKIKLFMCGNTINKYCPYFREMGLKHIVNQKQGTIDTYSVNTDEGDILKISVEYCLSISNKSSKASNKFFAFDNPKLKMISSGKWEVAIYPHLPIPFEKENIKYTYYINHDDNILQCEIINVNKCLFTFVHRKTTPIKYDLALKEGKMIYQEDYSPYPNVRRKITKPTTELEKKILSFYVRDKIFYQDNEIGEIMRNYLKWCGVSN